MGQQQSFSAYGTIAEILRVTPGSKPDTYTVYTNVSIASGFKNNDSKPVIDYRLLSIVFSNVSKIQANLLSLGAEISIFNGRLLSLNLPVGVENEIKEHFRCNTIDEIIDSIAIKSGIPSEILSQLIPTSRKTSIVEVPNNCWQLRATPQQVRNSNKIVGID